MPTAFHQRPLEAVFSRRAHAAICAETLAHHPDETGGILLGHFHQNRWQVLEAIDPGPGAICTATTFSYDRAYVSHLANKLARQYCRPLQLIGLWHRHPGSFDRFSAEDDTTNRRFAGQGAHGALSCLVNLDPGFRITAFHVPQDLRYQPLPIWIGDELIDAALRAQVDGSHLSPEQLRAAGVSVQLSALFNQRPRDPAPLDAALSTALPALLKRLERQELWDYGFKACGRTLQLGLLQRGGERSQLWELQVEPGGMVSARLHGAARHPSVALSEVLRGDRSDGH